MHTTSQSSTTKYSTLEQQYADDIERHSGRVHPSLGDTPYSHNNNQSTMHNMRRTTTTTRVQGVCILQYYYQLEQEQYYQLVCILCIAIKYAYQLVCLLLLASTSSYYAYYQLEYALYIYIYILMHSIIIVSLDYQLPAEYCMHRSSTRLVTTRTLYSCMHTTY